MKDPTYISWELQKESRENEREAVLSSIMDKYLELSIDIHPQTQESQSLS